MSIVDTLVYSGIERPTSLDQYGVIFEGQSYAYSMQVEQESIFDFIISWPGSELSLKVFDPNGGLVSFMSETDGEIRYSDSASVGGLWNFLVSGVETAEFGEFFRVQGNVRSDISEIPIPASGLLYLLWIPIGLFLRKRSRPI